MTFEEARKSLLEHLDEWYNSLKEVLSEQTWNNQYSHEYARCMKNINKISEKIYTLRSIELEDI